MCIKRSATSANACEIDILHYWRIENCAIESLFAAGSSGAYVGILNLKGLSKSRRQSYLAPMVGRRHGHSRRAATLSTRSFSFVSLPSVISSARCAADYPKYLKLAKISEMRAL